MLIPSKPINSLINFLAHAYLSFNDPDILVGNMISDFVKGRKKFDYPQAIQQGIQLHRDIDHFTDSHEATKKAKQIFSPVYRLYSGAFVDVVYDHFLATDSTEFSESALFSFTQEVYAELGRHIQYLPERFAFIFPYMRQQNWLYNYRSFEGAARSLAGVVRRAVYLVDSEPAQRLFREHYQLLEESYRHFWADIKSFARNEFEAIKRQAGSSREE